QRAAEPAAERDRPRKAEVEQRRGVVDLPAGHDHDHHRHRVGPVTDAYPDRMDGLVRRCVGCAMLLLARCKGRHGFVRYRVSSIIDVRAPEWPGYWLVRSRIYTCYGPPDTATWCRRSEIRDGAVPQRETCREMRAGLPRLAPSCAVWIGA